VMCWFELLPFNGYFRFHFQSGETYMFGLLNSILKGNF